MRQFRASRNRKIWQPLVWQQFGTRKGTTWLSLAAPRAGLARFEGFEGFEGFGRSIRQFRAIRKRTTWLATAASFSPEFTKKEPLGLPQPLVWQLQEPLWHGACGNFGPVETERLGLPKPLVWQEQFGTRKGYTCLSLAAPRAGLARFGGFEGFEGI